MRQQGLPPRLEPSAKRWRYQSVPPTQKKSGAIKHVPEIKRPTSPRSFLIWVPSFVVFALLSFFSNLEALLIEILTPILEFLPRGPGPFFTVCLTSCIAVHLDWWGEVVPIAGSVLGVSSVFLYHLKRGDFPNRAKASRSMLVLFGSSMISLAVLVLGTRVETTYGEGIRGNPNFDALASMVVYAGLIFAIQPTKPRVLSSAIIMYSLLVTVFFFADLVWLPSDVARGLSETVFGGAEFGDLNFIFPARAFFATLASNLVFLYVRRIVE